MPSLADTLASIPGYGAYVARRQMNEQQPMRELQQAGGVLSLQNILEQQEQQKQFRQTMAQAGGDVEAAMNAALRAGRPDVAARLAPLVEAKRKAGQGQPIGAGGLRMPSGEIVPPADRPKEFAPPEIVKLHEYLNSLPPNDPRGTAVKARIKKLTERDPGVTVNMPASSQTVVGPDGKFYQFRIGKDGKTEAIPIQTATGDPLKPPPSAADSKTAAEAAEGKATIESVRDRIGKMSALIRRSPTAVGPAGMVRRGVEAAGGVVEGLGGPGFGTDAISLENQQALLLADVRKLIEKDPNLSNQERERLYQSLGGGFIQTPTSAIQAMSEVMRYVEGKKHAGRISDLKGDAQLRQAVTGAGWAWEPGKYEYRILNGTAQRRAKGQ